MPRLRMEIGRMCRLVPCWYFLMYRCWMLPLPVKRLLLYQRDELLQIFTSKKLAILANQIRDVMPIILYIRNEMLVSERRISQRNHFIYAHKYITHVSFALSLTLSTFDIAPSTTACKLASNANIGFSNVIPLAASLIMGFGIGVATSVASLTASNVVV